MQRSFTDLMDRETGRFRSLSQTKSLQSYGDYTSEWGGIPWLITLGKVAIDIFLKVPGNQPIRTRVYYNYYYDYYIYYYYYYFIYIYILYIYIL